jgi:hypothetical protein
MSKSMSKTQSTVAALLPVLFVGACSNGGDPQCRFGADCASGVCSAQGRCVTPTNDASTDTADDTNSPVDGGSDTTPVGDSPVGCVPNGDDLITALELPFAAGLKATFRTATNATVSTAGTTGTDGRRHWDFSGALSGDKDLIVETLPPAGAWWAPQFTGATYATSITSAADLLGVFQVTTGALLLQGEVSSTDGATRTLLTNATPVPTLQFPLDPSSAWTVTTLVNGQTSGVPSSYTESYDSKVDAVGDVVTPFSTFRVLRVRTVLTRTVGALPTVVRTFAFVTDCFGPVVTITSNPNETLEEFTTAAEIRRLAP